MAYAIDRLQRVELGRCGENLARRVAIDASTWLGRWPGARLEVLCHRPTESTLYIPDTLLDGAVLLWTVTAADTAFPGTGRGEVRAILGDVVVKSAVFDTVITPALEGTAGDPPAAGVDWATDVIQAADRAEAASKQAVDAKMDAEAAAEQAEENVRTALQEAKDSGEFDGAPGEDGYTPIKGVDYFDGAPGTSGVYLGKEAPTDETVNVWIDPEGDAYYPIATRETLGGVKVGDGLTVDETGVLSAEVKGADLDKLSEEIENLKEEGGISGGTSTTVSGTLITMDCDEGSEIVVEGETTDAVTLVHCGKNIMPPLPGGTTTRVGVTFTQNVDGKITVTGTASSRSWPDYIPANAPIFLPAGSYTLTVNDLIDDLGFTFSSVDKEVSVGFFTSSTIFTPSKSFTLEEGKNFQCYFTVSEGAVYSGEVISIQLEAGDTASAYEPMRKDVKSGVTLPITISAFAGGNTIYTENGVALTAVCRKSVGAIINEAVAKQLAVDWSAYGLPMLYLTGDTAGMTKDNAVDLAYVYGDLSGTASVKWQGSSSLSWPKKNYTIKFDQEFEAVEGWGAQKKYCFKANFIDHSHARNVCSCKLWGQIVKSRANVPAVLSALPNGGAIDGFPCIIMLNGEFHGLYTWNIPKDGWMFGSPKAILCADAHTDATKFKALATLNGDFELEYVEDENNADWVLTSINTAIQAVMGGNLDTVAQYIDIPSAIDYYIHTVDEDANDGTDKNYILVTFDGVKWYFSAYDRDTVYGLHWTGKSFATPVGGITYAQYASAHAMMKLIRDNKTADLKARAVELRDGIKSEANVATVFSNFIGSIPSQVFDEDARKWPTIPNTSASNLAQILNWYRLRRQIIDKEIDAM